MKKRLLLAIVFVLAICSIFALSVGAKTIKAIDGTQVEVTIYDDAPVKSTFASSTNDYVIFDDGFACPSPYIFKDQASVGNGSYGNAGLNKALDFSFLAEKGKNYTIGNIVEIDIPQGITTIGTQFGHSLTALKKITIPSSVTSLGGTGFQNSSNLQEFVFEHTEKDSDFTTLSGWMFAGCSSLKAISFPDCITTITGEGNFFNGCSSLGAVYLSKNIETLEKTGSNRYAVFQNLSKVYFVNEPFTTSDTAPEKPSIYYFPESLTTVSGNTFEGATSLNSVLVFGKNITSASGSYLFKNVTSTVVFLGDMTEINTTNWKTSKIIFANPADKSSTDFTSYTNSRTTVFCASESDASKHLASPRNSTIEKATCYSNEKGVTRCFCNFKISEGETPNTKIDHTYVDDFDCTTQNKCKEFANCGAFLEAAANAHNEKHAVAYADGFAKGGLHTIWCDNEGCNALDDKITLDAIFGTTGGYAISADGGLAGGWTFNATNFNLYNLYNENDIKFGVLMANPKHLASNKIFSDDMSVNLADGKKGALIVDDISTEYSSFKFSISGFVTEELQNLELIVTSFAYVDGEDVEFIQAENTACKVTTTDFEDGTLYTVNYATAKSALAVEEIDAIVPSKEY